MLGESGPEYSLKLEVSVSTRVTMMGVLGLRNRKNEKGFGILTTYTIMWMSPSTPPSSSATQLAIFFASSIGLDSESQAAEHWWTGNVDNAPRR